MRKLLLASAVALACGHPAHSLPIPGYNSVTTHCLSYIDNQTDPIKSPGMAKSAHIHSHYGITTSGFTDAKILGDKAQKATVPGSNRVQNIPGGGVNPNFRNPGYVPLSHTCQPYGGWAWYAIPTPNDNGKMGLYNRRGGRMQTDPTRVVSLMTLTWAAPVGVYVYEPPYGMTAIVGNAHAMNEAEQDNDHVYWTCGDLTTKSRAPRDCTAEKGLVTGVLVFPNCWNGKAEYPNFDVQMGIDRTHFRYSDGLRCPEGFAQIAQLFMSVHFVDTTTRKRMVNPLNSNGAMKLGFASGPYYTFHADFGNLWSQVNHGIMLAACLNGEDYYGGFHKLNQYGDLCNFQRIPLEECPPLNPESPDDVLPPICRNPK